MNRFDRINSKNIDEFSEWLDKYGAYDYSPWMEWWDKNYCRKCEPEIVDGKEYGWCELHGKCRFFQEMDEIPNHKQTIKMWLEGEDEDEDEEECEIIYGV